MNKKTDQAINRMLFWATLAVLSGCVVIDRMFKIFMESVGL